MSNLLSDVDARTRLAGTNRLELLLFTLADATGGRRPEVFGVNVFKVQEVIQTPAITSIPNAPPFVVGMTSLRGQVVSVINLIGLCGLDYQGLPPQMIVTEFSRSVQAFLVHGVETIVRVDWADVKQPPAMLANSKVTAVTELPDGRLVSILDVEQILHGVSGVQDVEITQPEFLDDPEQYKHLRIIAADDAAFARNQLKTVLDGLKIQSEILTNGAEAWRRLDGLASHYARTGEKLSEHVPVVITDIEMPEMDGFILTKKIKEDTRFAGVKVLIHSSMSGQSNTLKANEMGADGFLAKFSAREVAQQLSGILKSTQRQTALLESV